LQDICNVNRVHKADGARGFRRSQIHFRDA